MTVIIQWGLSGVHGRPTLRERLGPVVAVLMKLNEAWNANDAKRLRQLREEVGWSLPDLARRACLSVAQVMQLEQGGDSHFYTAAIKQLAGRRAFLAVERWTLAQRCKAPAVSAAEATSQVRAEAASEALSPSSKSTA